MTIYTSNDRAKFKGEAYSFKASSSIVVPGKSRYVIARKHHKMFHCGLDLKATKECPNPDHSNFCPGHTMSRREFLDEFCGGMLPPELVKS